VLVELNGVEKPFRFRRKGFSFLHAAKQAGFTLIELVAIMVLAGILAVTALPRMVQFSEFDQRGFLDQTLSGLRFAQKTAIAQRRWVKVTDAANGFSLSYCGYTGGNGCSANTASCSSAVLDPSTGAAFSIAAPSGVGMSHSGASPFYFDCEGRPVNASGVSVASSTYTVTTSGASNLSLTVETETGYVHR
jgi:MSHA pilin protein MshC